MKKGATHVDWAISMGIFLVFVMLTLIFLRPSPESVYGGENLIRTVAAGLENDTQFSLYKSPLLIYPDSNLVSGNYKLRIRNPTANGLSNVWRANGENLGLVNDSLGKVSPGDLLYTLYDLDNETCSCTTDDVLDIETYIISGETNIYWLVYSKEVTYPPADVIINDLTSPEVLLDGENFTYSFGFVEKQEGFLPFKLEDLDGLADDPDDPNDDYDLLKDMWNIPEGKNFKVTIQQIV